jgi:DNA-binding NarL/FixJ family response regulator
VANLIKEGKTNKEIAVLMLISKNTVLFHRHHICTKLGLKQKRSTFEPTFSRMLNSGFPTNPPLFYQLDTRRR